MAAENAKKKKKKKKNASEIFTKGLQYLLTLVPIYGIRAQEKEKNIV